MSTFATLRSLHSLIGTALDDIERAFYEHDIPLDFPSHEDPCNPSSPAETLLSSPAMVEASKLVVASAGQLSAMVQRPFLTICDASMGYNLASCMRFLEAAHVVEILKETGIKGLHVREIARKVECDEGKLTHVLRLLATHHIGTEVTPDVFANNRLSSLVDSGKSFEEIKAQPLDKYDGTNGIAAFVGMCSDDLFKASAFMTDAYLINASTKYSALPSASPFNMAFNTNQPFFNWLESEGNEMRLKRFGKAMTGTAGYSDGDSFSSTKGIDWPALPEGSLVVDVGGGIGSTSMELAKAYPNLHFCIQDRPKVVEMGPAAWNDCYPGLIDSGRITFQAHDFFEPQPIKDAAVFHLRVITHDWPDAFSRRILLQLRQAATPNTKLVITDYILPHACEDNTGNAGVVKTFAPPGSKLLANLGKANANAFSLDMIMCVTFNSQERTLREISQLALSAGWAVREVVRKTEGTLFGSVVAVPVSIPQTPELILPAVEQEISLAQTGTVDSFDSDSKLVPFPTFRRAAVAARRLEPDCKKVPELRWKRRRGLSCSQW